MVHNFSVFGLVLSVITLIILTSCPCYADLVTTTAQDYNPDFYEGSRSRLHKQITFFATKWEKEKNKPDFDKNSYIHIFSYIGGLYKQDLVFIGKLLNNPKKYNLSEKQIKTLQRLQNKDIPADLEVLNNYIKELGGDTKSVSSAHPGKTPFIAILIAMGVFSLSGLYVVRSRVSAV